MAGKLPMLEAFAGIGGCSQALKPALRTVLYCEIDPASHCVLRSLTQRSSQVVLWALFIIDAGARARSADRQWRGDDNSPVVADIPQAQGGHNAIPSWTAAPEILPTSFSSRLHTVPFVLPRYFSLPIRNHFSALCI